MECSVSEKKTAGELAQKALSDNTKYKAIDVGHGMAEDLEKHLYEAVENYHEKIDQNEFCVVMLLAKDPLLCNLVRRKFYCWPFLPKPRPNQAVFLYNKAKGRIVKRLWCLPSDAVMAELASLAVVDKTYKTMQAWSIAFFEGNFWEYIRYEHGITMLSEHEHHLKSGHKLAQPSLNSDPLSGPDAFDFTKISAGKFQNPDDVSTSKNLQDAFVEC